MTEEDEQLCMSYALGTLDPEERLAFELRLNDSPALVDRVKEFETLYAEQELGESTPQNTRLKEAIMSQISGEQAATTPSADEGTQPMLASQAMWLLVFGATIVTVCFSAFGVSLLK